MTRRGRRVPLVAVLLALVAVAFFVLPLIGLLRRVPWGDLWDDLGEPQARDAIRLSVECSLWSTFFSVLFGVPLAYVLARARFPGRSLVRALVVLPMVLPPFLLAMGWVLLASPRTGFLNRLLSDAFCLSGPPFNIYTMGGMIFVETLALVPSVYLILCSAFRNMDRDEVIVTYWEKIDGRWRLDDVESGGSTPWTLSVVLKYGWVGED